MRRAPPPGQIRGTLIITPTVGGLELVRVVKAANGILSTTGPEPYYPSA
jgi:hypothetical protein